MSKTAIATKDQVAKAKLDIETLNETAIAIRDEILNSDGIQKSIAMASGVLQIHEAFSDAVLAVFMGLQGNELGFKTDKDHAGGYAADVVKQVAVRALMHGAHLHGNEFNIIASGCYLTKNFYKRKLREYEGLTDLFIDVFAPDSSEVSGKNRVYRVRGKAACRVDGKEVVVDCMSPETAVVVSAFDNGTALDGALGKAEKRLAQKLYERIAGVEITDDSDGGATVNVVEPPEKLPAPAEDSRAADKAEAFKTLWRSELTLPKKFSGVGHKASCEAMKTAAGALFSIYEKGESAAPELDAYMGQLSDVSELQQREREKLERFATSILTEWEANAK